MCQTMDMACLIEPSYPLSEGSTMIPPFRTGSLISNCDLEKMMASLFGSSWILD